MKASQIKVAFAALAAAGVVAVSRAGVPASAVEAVPSTMNYQGVLRDPTSGEKYVDGNYKFEFRLFDSLSGGSCLWGGTYAVTVKDGYFSVMLGDRSANELIGKPTSKYKNAELWKAFWGATENDTVRYLAVTPYQNPQGRPVSLASEVSPRQRILSAPFASRALRAHYVKTVDFSEGDFTVEGSTNCKGPLTARNAMTTQGALTANSTAKFAGAVEATSDLSVAGKLTASGAVEAKNTLSVAGNVDAKSNLAVGGDATVAGNLVVKGKITRNNVEVVPVPVGGIVVWSQTNAPNNEVWATTGNGGHWAICNGQTVNGLKTPDLRDRFIVGAGGNYALGDTGGTDSVTLTVDQMPKHKHTTYIHGAHKWMDRDDHKVFVLDWLGADWSISHTYESTEVGGGQSHENRPPYYALYYIMRVL